MVILLVSQNFLKRGSKILKEYLTFQKNNMKDYYTIVFNKMINDGKEINYIDIKNFFWKEIDKLRDIKNMNKIINNQRFNY